MFRSYLKTAVRNILKYKAFSFINVFGLALAMSVCMLLMLMLAEQKKFDRFHVKKDRIYRILSDRDNSKLPSATTPFSLAETLKNDYSIIEESTHLTRGIGGDMTHQQRVVEMRGYFADPAFFKIFSYELQEGDVDNALLLPNSMVITEACARQLFNDENPVGKTVGFSDRGLSNMESGPGDAPVDWNTFTITGVIDDKQQKSHLVFDVLVSSSSMKLLLKEGKLEDLTNQWANNQSYTYVLLQGDKSQADLTNSFHDLIQRKKVELQDIRGFTLIPQKLGEITPGMLVSNAPGYTLPLVVYYFLSFLALVILVSACLNYTNLSTARALTRQ